MTVEVREAQLEDSPSVTRMLLELGYDAEEALVRRRIERVLGSTDHVIFVVGERPHGLIGVMHAFVSITLTQRPHVEIGTLVVSGSHRQSGAGRALLERVHNWALRRGIDDVATRFKRHRKAGHAFYGKMGYTAVADHRVYRRDLASPMRNDDTEDPTAMD